MAKMRIYDIATSLQGKFPDLKGKELVNLLNENGFEVKSVQNSIEDDAIAFLMKYYHKKEMEANAALKAGEKAMAAQAEKTEKKVKKEKTAAEGRAASEGKTAAEGRAALDEKERKADTEKEEKSKAVNAEPAKEEEPVKEEKTVEIVKEREEEKAKKENPAGNKTGKEDKTVSTDRASAQEKSSPGTKPQTSTAPKKEKREGAEKSEKPRRNEYEKGSGSRGNGKEAGKEKRQNGFPKGGRDNRENRDRDNKDGRNGNNYGGNGKRDSKRNASAPLDSMKSEVKQSRQQRANKDSRSAKQRYGKDKSRDDFDDDFFGQQAGKKKKKDPNRKGAFIKPEPVKKKEEQDDGIRTITLPEKMTVKDLADAIKVQPSVVIKNQFMKGNVVTINHELTFEEAEEIALEYNCIAELEEKVDLIEEILKEDEEDEALMKKRPPVVCVMGHVDHGKTSLLDAIREAHVTDKEAGGITQHIGAYMTEIGGEKITFLDTPGHEAFTSMRMRGAQSTDIAVLVVAADDGVMPQTVEAINHAKAAGVEIIVAVNKIDKPSANVERVKQELMEHELVAEDWGGSTVFVPVSAHTKEGIDQLLEMIILTAEVLELKANPNRKARGVVVEAQLDKGRGPVATVLVQKGTLRVGDHIAVGAAYGKIRAMMNEKGQRLTKATPSTPVEILGLHAVPDAGEIFMATENDKEARNIADIYINQGKEKLLDETKSKLTLDGLFSQIQAGNIKELNLIVKADVQGSVEAIKQSLLKLSNDEVAVRIIHGGVGAIN